MFTHFQDEFCVRFPVRQILILIIIKRKPKIPYTRHAAAASRCGGYLISSIYVSTPIGPNSNGGPTSG